MKMYNSQMLADNDDNMDINELEVILNTPTDFKIPDVKQEPIQVNIHDNQINKKNQVENKNSQIDNDKIDHIQEHICEENNISHPIRNNNEDQEPMITDIETNFDMEKMRMMITSSYNHSWKTSCYRT